MQRIPPERPREGTAYQSLECLPQIELIVQSLIFSSFVSRIPKISRLKFLTACLHNSVISGYRYSDDMAGLRDALSI